jgi:hypothetical protein
MGLAWPVEKVIMAQMHSQQFCAVCGETRLFVKPGTSHGVHLIISLFLCGLWIPVWFLDTLCHNLTRSRCSVCGARSGTAGKAPARPSPRLAPGLRKVFCSHCGTPNGVAESMLGSPVQCCHCAAMFVPSP